MSGKTAKSATKRFLAKHGIPLAKFGSADYGLSRSDAIQFVEVLRQNRKNVLGAEVWRWNEGRYKMDSLMTWYAIEHDLEMNLMEIEKFVQETDLAECDLLTLQFSEDAEPEGFE